MTETAEVREAPESIGDRIFAAILGMIDVHSIYIGDRLGLYRALAGGAETPAEVAAVSGTHERYVREWLEQQAVTGILAVAAPEEEPGKRRFRIPDEHGEALLDYASVDCMAPFVRMMAGIVRPLPMVLEAFRAGGGVPYAAYDADFCDGQGDMNGAMFDRLLASEWIPAVPALHRRLESDPPARVADVACGTGRSTLAIARGYPRVSVDGVDIDRHSIDVARSNLAGEPGLADRVGFAVGDAAGGALAGPYDVVTIFEAVHDLSDPVGVLRSVRELVAPGGTVVVADERVAESFTADGDEVERAMYGFSLLHCLPVGMAEQPSAATGTVMRPATLRDYAQRAGFTEVEVLAIENDFWRFYRLVP